MIKITEGIIREYDMECACLSMLVSSNVISEGLFLDLKEGDKLTRNILIGKLQINNEEMKKTISDGIAYYIDQIKKSLKDPNNIIEIAKDAIFVTNEIPDKTKMDDFVNFVLKGEYYLLVEIPVSTGSNTYVKLYKNNNTLKVRYSKIDTEHPAYKLLYEILRYRMNNSYTGYFLFLNKFKKAIENTDKRVIAALDNKYLYECLSELM